MILEKNDEEDQLCISQLFLFKCSINEIVMKYNLVIMNVQLEAVGVF